MLIFLHTTATKVITSISYAQQIKVASQTFSLISMHTFLEAPQEIDKKWQQPFGGSKHSILEISRSGA
jgi:hypothetical protein